MLPLFLSLLLWSVPSAPSSPAAGQVGGAGMAITIQSTAFSEGATIPKKHTCDGPDVSPPLSWSGVPPKAESLALICHDPDAPVGDWVHWVLYDLPATATGLPEGIPRDRETKDSSRQGMNDFGKLGYNGPCPPRGPAHRYVFRLYALSQPLSLKAGATRQEVLKAAKGHILAEGELTGRYGR